MIILPKFSTELQFHLLRHFNKVPRSYLQKLSNQSNYNEAQILAQLRLPGSKFNPEFAESPLHLEHRIREIGAASWKIALESAEKTDYLLTFSDQSWPNGIGQNQVISAKSLTAKELALVKRRSRGNFIVQTLAVEHFPVTHQLVLIVGRNQEPISIFPGKWLPALNDQIIHEYIFLTER